MMRCYFPLLLLLLPLAASAGAPAGAEGAHRFVDALGTQVLEVINAPGAGEEQKQQQLRQLFTRHVDIPWMGRFVLGRFWQKATPAQRERYLRAYQEYLLARYTSNFADYHGSKYTVTEVRTAGDGDFMVGMRIDAPDQPQEVAAGYRVHADEGGRFAIRDLMVEGVSQITTQRSEFASVVQREGVDALIGLLEEKTKVDAAAP